MYSHDFNHTCFGTRIRESVVLRRVVIQNFFRFHKFLNLFCNSLSVLLVLVNFVVRDVVDRVNCNSLMHLGKSSRSVKCYRFPEACLHIGSRMRP